MSHAVLGWDAQAQVDVVGHRMPFEQFDSSLGAQLPKDWADLMPQPSVEDFPAVLRYDHYVVLALPPHMGQALPFVPKLLLPAPRGLPGKRSYAIFRGLHAGSLEALRVTRPKAVDLERINRTHPFDPV
jgi:hypothetical protein